MTAPITTEDAEHEPNNVRMFPDRTPATAFPKRSYAISVTSPAGYPITITLNDMKLDLLDDALATLLERGYMPAEAHSAPANPTQQAAATDAQPICPYHGPMKESDKRPGTYYCPKKMADGSGYCKEKFPR